MGQEREKKILVPNSVPTRAGLPFQKKKAKKLKNFDAISIQTGMRYVEKEKKKI